MPPKSEAPHDGGASRNSCGGTFRDPLSLLDTQAQFLVVAYHVRPALAGTVATPAFGGSAP